MRALFRFAFAVGLVAIPFLGCSATDGADDGADDTGDGYGVESALVSGGGLRATTAVNLRQAPSTSSPILHVIPKGDAVTVISATPKGGFYNVKHAGVVGWAYGIYFTQIGPSRPTSVDALKTIAARSQCYQYSWKDRGRMPLGYVQGVALVFAKAACHPERSDVVLVSKAKTTDTARDALAWYSANFTALGMSNGADGVTTLRHVYTLLMGLGMRESSGEHCVGRDGSASNFSASSCEAGAWQTSYDSRSASLELPKLFSKYRSSSAGCYLDTFRTGVSCSAADWKNWGDPGDGLDFQRIEKACPAFAAEYAAVMLRVQGGTSGHYGPLRTKAAEIRPECDAMLLDVQRAVEADPSICSAL